MKKESVQPPHAKPATLQPHYDIAIIGGGMVGASLAVSLLPAARELGLSIAVFESVALPSDPAAPLQPSYDARSTALSYGSRTLLQVMGVWDALAENACAIEHIQVSDRGHFGQVNLDAKSEQVDALGYVVENRVLGQVLWQQLSAARLDGQPAVDVFCPAEVTAIKRQSQDDQQHMLLTLNTEAGEQTTQAALVVMADGGRSSLRAQMGIEYDEVAYDQYALIANISLDRPHQGHAYERFTADGPLALLPLLNTSSVSSASAAADDTAQGARCALVWTTPESAIETRQAWTDEQFIAALQQQLGYRAGRVIQVGERHAYPLKLSQSREQIRPGLVVLGNAAHTLHPIAGQGFNLALRGALTLAETLIEASIAEQPLGALNTLQGFYSKLEWDQQKTIGFSDKVTRLFSNDHAGAVLARNLGLVALEFLPPAKAYLSRSAMGMDMPIPQLQPSQHQVN